MLRARIKEIAWQRVRYGHKRTAMLVRTNLPSIFISNGVRGAAIRETRRRLSLKRARLVDRLIFGHRRACGH